MISRDNRRLLAAIVLAGVAFRALYAWKFPQWGPGGAIPDLNWYETLAESLLKFGELRDPVGRLTAAREPGYPALLALLYSVAGGPSYRLGQVLNCVLGAGVIVLTWRLAKELFGEKAGLLAAAIAAFYPQFVYYCSTLERETFQTALFAGALLLLLRASRSPSTGRFAAAGAVLALAALTNSVFLPAGVALFAAAAWQGRRSRPRVRGSAAGLAALLALYALWPIRNATVFGRFILGINGGGAHLYVGLIVPNEAAGTPEETRIMEADAVNAAAARLPESERDALYYRESLKLMASRPLHTARVVFLSFVKLWRLYPYQRAYAHGYGRIFWAAILSDGWIIPLALIGAILAWRRRVPDVLLPLVGVAAVSGVYAVFWSIIRYRLPMMPVAIGFAAFALTEAWKSAARAAARR